MKTLLRLLASAVSACVLAGSASAHFIWIHVLEDGRVEVLFGDGVYQDTDANLVRYVHGIEARLASGEALEFEEHSWGLSGVRGDERAVLATCDMNVFSRPGAGPAVKLDYYAKGVRTFGEARDARGNRAEIVAEVHADELLLRALFDGKPAAGAVFTVPHASGVGEETVEADERGEVRRPAPVSGVWSAKAKVVVERAGEHEGQAYVAENHYATLVVADARPDLSIEEGSRDARLRLESAWRNTERLDPELIGLAGTLIVNLDGTSWRGEFHAMDGELLEFALADAPSEHLPWIREQVAEMVAARLDTGYASDFGTGAVTIAARDGHPLGRALRVDDEFDTEVRLVENRIRSIARSSGDGRRVLEQFLADEESESGRRLPTHFVRQSLDAQGGVVETATFIDDFREAGGRHLPARREIVRVRDGAVHTLSIAMRNLELYDVTDREAGTR